jgi:hypothetical protein
VGLISRTGYTALDANETTKRIADEEKRQEGCGTADAEEKITEQSGSKEVSDDIAT